MIAAMNPGFFLRFALMFVAVFAAIFLFVWFYLSVTSPAEAGEPPRVEAASAAAFETETLSVRTRAGQAFDFRVEVARTPAQQRLGLMHRTDLAADAGMIFVYEPPRQVAMWMKNTRIALDMLFAGANGTVFYIHENAQPMSEDLIVAPGVAAYVLELPGGTVRRLGLSVGDRLVL